MHYAFLTASIPFPHRKYQLQKRNPLEETNNAANASNAANAGSKVYRIKHHAQPVKASTDAIFPEMSERSPVGLDGKPSAVDHQDFTIDINHSVSDSQYFEGIQWNTVTEANQFGHHTPRKPPRTRNPPNKPENS